MTKIEKRSPKFSIISSLALAIAIVSACAASTAESEQPIDAAETSSYFQGEFSAAGLISSSDCPGQQMPMRLVGAIRLTDDIDQDEVSFEIRGQHIFGPECFEYKGDLIYEGALIRQGSSYKFHESDADDDWYLDLVLSADSKTLSGTFRDEHHYTGPDGKNTGTATGTVTLRRP
jgi:hypothetical protein